MIDFPSVRNAGVIVTSVVVLAACQDEMVRPDQGALPEEIAALPQGVHPIVSIPGLESAVPGSVVSLRIHLHAVEVEDEVASYQGVFVFDPEAFQVQSGDFAEGVLGAWNQVEPGRIRFAGAVLEGVGTRPILELRGRLGRVPVEGDFLVEIEELVAAEKLSEMTASVTAPGESPIVTGADLAIRPR